MRSDRRRSLVKFNDNYKYILSVIDVFSKFVYVIPLKSKTGTDVGSVFLSIFKDPKYSKLDADPCGCERISAMNF